MNADENIRFLKDQTIKFAHDIGNMLYQANGVNHFVGQFAFSEKIKKRSCELDNILMRITMLVQDHLSVIEGHEPYAIDLNLSEFVARHLEDINYLVSHNDVSMNLKLAENIPEIKIVPSDLDRLLGNLIKNGLEAFSLTDAKEIFVETGCQFFDMKELENMIWHSPYFEEGNFVYLRVSDNALGMNEETLQLIFEKGYSSKSSIQGEERGVGLSSVKEIVEKYGVALNVCSSPGEGSEFSILFPFEEEFHRMDMEEDKAVDWNLSDSFVQEKILYVDDDPVYLERVCQFFSNEKLSDHFIFATSAVESMHLFEKYERKILAIIVDSHLDDMDVEELIEKYRKINADVRVLLISRFTQKELEKDYKHLKVEKYLRKSTFLDSGYFDVMKIFLMDFS
jgi:CheY-like chemotaxis protein